jgi:hypothetical protein
MQSTYHFTHLEKIITFYIFHIMSYFLHQRDKKLNQPGHLKRWISIGLRKSGHGTHSWLSGHASRDDDNVCTAKSLGKTIIWREVALDLGWSGDVREIGGNTWRVDDIIQAELEDVHTLVGLQCHVTFG